jgi:diamine N-acetyltransferase
MEKAHSSVKNHSWHYWYNVCIPAGWSCTFMAAKIIQGNTNMTDVTPTLTRNSSISLREVTAETVRAICRLEVNEEQKHFVAPNAVSIAEAYFESKAWFRAIYADDTPVGFLMLYDDPEEPNYFLWRFMVDAHYQKMGFGKRAMDLLVEYVRTRPGAHELRLSCHPGEQGPEPFYRKYGFALTGKMIDREAEMRIDL